MNDTTKKTKKEFIKHLNEVVGKGWTVTTNYKAYKRAYGDYLYSQDRDMFNYQYNLWLEEKDE